MYGPHSPDCGDIHRSGETVHHHCQTRVGLRAGLPRCSRVRYQGLWKPDNRFIGRLWSDGTGSVCLQYHNDTSLKNPQWALATSVFSPRDISRIEREFLDVVDFQLRVTEADLLTLERPFISAFFSPKSRTAYNSSSSSNYQQEEEDVDDEEEDGSSRWSDSDEEDDVTTDFTSSPSGSDRSISPKTPSTALGSFPLPPSSEPTKSTTDVVAPPSRRHSCPPPHSQIPFPLSV